MGLSRDKNRGDHQYILTVRFDTKRSPLEKQTVEYLQKQSEGIKSVNGSGDPLRILMNQMVESMLSKGFTPSGEPVDVLRCEMNLRMEHLQTIMENVGLEVLGKMDNLSVGIVHMDEPPEPLDAIPDGFFDDMMDDHYDDE